MLCGDPCLLEISARNVAHCYAGAFRSDVDSPMWYAIIGTDREGSLEARRNARPAHLARLNALRDAGRLLLAGPFPAIDAEDPGPAGFTGSLVVAEFDSLDAARAWAEADPYRAAGVYRNVEVRPFRKVLS